MDDSFRDHDRFAGRQIEGAIFEIDQELATDDVEELVFLLVLVPMIFAVDHAEAHDRFVDLAQRLVIPAIGARIDEAGDVDHFERSLQNVEARVVRKPGR